jgi:hypothetical protein
MGIKHYQQAKGYCGISDVRMVFYQFGFDVPRKELVKRLKPSYRSGCDIIKKRHTLETIISAPRFRTLTKLNSSVDEMGVYTDAGIPVIPYVWEWENQGTEKNPDYIKTGHFIVVHKVDDKIHIANSACEKNSCLTRQGFENKWYDIKTPNEKKEILVLAPEYKFLELPKKFWPSEMKR